MGTALSAPEFNALFSTRRTSKLQKTKAIHTTARGTPLSEIVGRFSASTTPGIPPEVTLANARLVVRKVFDLTSWERLPELDWEGCENSLFGHSLFTRDPVDPLWIINELGQHGGVNYSEGSWPETSFFRNIPSLHLFLSYFQTLQEQGHVNIWSAGASFLAEAFSISMCLQARGIDPSSYTIHATDLDPRVLDIGKAGRFPHKVVRHLDQRIFDRFFKKEEEDQFRLDPLIVDDVEAQAANLLRAEELHSVPAADVTFAINVFSPTNLIQETSNKRQALFYTMFKNLLDKTKENGLVFINVGPITGVLPSNDQTDFQYNIVAGCRIEDREEGMTDYVLVLQRSLWDPKRLFPGPLEKQLFERALSRLKTKDRAIILTIQPTLDRLSASL